MTLGEGPAPGVVVAHAAGVATLADVEPLPGVRVATGIAGLDRVLGQDFRTLKRGLHVPSVVIFGGAAGCGKCVSGATRVLDPSTGDYLPITAWSLRQRPVVAIDSMSLRLRARAVLAFRSNGVRDVVEVTTRLGNKIRCTPDHPVLTPAGWCHVSDVGVGGRLAAPRELPFFGQEPLDERHARLLGYMIGDGSIGAAEACSFTTASAEDEADIVAIAAWMGASVRRYPKKGSSARSLRFYVDREERRACRLVFAAELRAAMGSRRGAQADLARRAGVSVALVWQWLKGGSVPTPEVLRRIASVVHRPYDELRSAAYERARKTNPVARFLREAGLGGTRSGTKFVPDCVFRAPRASVAAFLCALFSTDGSVFVNKQGSAQFYYATTSERLARDVQHLLLRFGIVSRLRCKTVRALGRPYRSYGVVVVGVREVRCLLGQIGIHGRDAAKAQIAGMKEAKIAPSTRDTVPTDMDFWRAVRRAVPEGNQRDGTAPDPRRAGRPLARKTVQRIAARSRDPRLTALACGDVYWDEIVSLVAAGREEVFDIEVQGDASFFAEGLFVHNSTLTMAMAAKIQCRGFLYVSSEQTLQEIRANADRWRIAPDALARIPVFYSRELGDVLAKVRQLDPQVVVMDSLNELVDTPNDSNDAHANLVRHTAAFKAEAEASDRAFVLISHLNKKEELAGVQRVVHLCSAVMYITKSGRRQRQLACPTKNRFGDTAEVAHFDMTSEGLKEREPPPPTEEGAAGSGARRRKGASGARPARGAALARLLDEDPGARYEFEAEDE